MTVTLRRLTRRINRNGAPAHVQIEDRVAEAIAGGELRPGDRLPPERDLAERLGVSRMTLRQSLDSLERRGLVIRVRGRTGGTFVAGPKFEMDVNRLAGLTEQLRRQGRHAGAKVLRARQGPAGRRSAQELGLEAGDAVFEVVRLRLSDGEPLALERSVFPAEILPGLLQAPLDGSLYQVLEQRYRLPPVRAVERLEPVLATTREAETLGVREGAPLLLVERTAYGRADTPLEYARDLFRADRTRVLVESGRRR